MIVQLLDRDTLPNFPFPKPPNSETLSDALIGCSGRDELKLSLKQNSSRKPLKPPNLQEAALIAEAVYVPDMLSPSMMIMHCPGENLTAKECHVLRVNACDDVSEKLAAGILTETVRLLLRVTAKTWELPLKSAKIFPD